MKQLTVEWNGQRLGVYRHLDYWVATNYLRAAVASTRDVAIAQLIQTLVDDAVAAARRASR
jgi:hypothetical protein